LQLRAKGKGLAELFLVRSRWPDPFDPKHLVTNAINLEVASLGFMVTLGEHRILTERQLGQLIGAPNHLNAPSLGAAVGLDDQRSLV
jgi:hypothetical protein